MSIGTRWACCATADDLRCAPRPRDDSGARLPISQHAYASRTTVRFPENAAVREVVVAGDAVCVRGNNDVVRCHADLRRPALPWMQLPGVFLAFKGGQISGEQSPALCGILRNESIACFRFVGEHLEPIGTVDDRFRGVRVGATTACGVNGGEDAVCWPLPTASSQQPLATTRRLAAADGQVVALDLWDDAGCAVVKGKGVFCWEGDSEVRKLRVSVTSNMPAALRLGSRMACITFQAGHEIRCWKRGATIWDGEALPVRPTGRSEAFLGAQEACTVAWLGQQIECWNELHAAIPYVAEAPEPRTAAPPAARPARRPPHLETTWAFHGAIPFSYGAGWYRTRSGTSQGSWLRFRAVAAWGPERTNLVDDDGRSVDGNGKRHRWAAGPYAEVAWHRVAPERQLSVGAGAIGICWFSALWALTPTLGWYQQQHAGAPTEQGLAVGLGIDNASREWGPLLVPIGLRLEARYGLGGGPERSILVSGEADTIIAFAAPVGLYMLAKADWRF